MYVKAYMAPIFLLKNSQFRCSGRLYISTLHSILCWLWYYVKTNFKAFVRVGPLRKIKLFYNMSGKFDMNFSFSPILYLWIVTWRKVFTEKLFYGKFHDFQILPNRKLLKRKLGIKFSDHFFKNINSLIFDHHSFKSHTSASGRRSRPKNLNFWFSHGWGLGHCIRAMVRESGQYISQ